MDTDDIITAINTVTDTDELRRIYDACNARRKGLRALETAATLSLLQKGDTVVLDGLSPKYLNGARCRVTEVLKSRVSVVACDDEDYRVKDRLGGGRGARVPASCVTKVDA